MTAESRKTSQESDQGKERAGGQLRPGPKNNDACRCKEVSKMSPRQLFKVMISDLAFWKKSGKG
jgi:hypothetical protein